MVDLQQPNIILQTKIQPLIEATKGQNVLDYWSLTLEQLVEV